MVSHNEMWPISVSVAIAVEHILLQFDQKIHAGHRDVETFECIRWALDLAGGRVG